MTAGPVDLRAELRRIRERNLLVADMVELRGGSRNRDIARRLRRIVGRYRLPPLIHNGRKPR